MFTGSTSLGRLCTMQHLLQWGQLGLLYSNILYLKFDEWKLQMLSLQNIGMIAAHYGFKKWKANKSTPQVVVWGRNVFLGLLVLGNLVHFQYLNIFSFSLHMFLVGASSGILTSVYVRSKNANIDDIGLYITCLAIFGPVLLCEVLAAVMQIGERTMSALSLIHCLVGASLIFSYQNTRDIEAYAQELDAIAEEPSKEANKSDAESAVGDEQGMAERKPSDCKAIVTFVFLCVCVFILPIVRLVRYIRG